MPFSPLIASLRTQRFDLRPGVARTGGCATVALILACGQTASAQTDPLAALYAPRPPVAASPNGAPAPGGPETLTGASLHQVGEAARAGVRESERAVRDALNGGRATGAVTTPTVGQGLGAGSGPAPLSGSETSSQIGAAAAPAGGATGPCPAAADSAQRRKQIAAQIEALVHEANAADASGDTARAQKASAMIARYQAEDDALLRSAGSTERCKPTGPVRPAAPPRPTYACISNDDLDQAELIRGEYIPGLQSILDTGNPLDGEPVYIRQEIADLKEQLAELDGRAAACRAKTAPIKVAANTPRRPAAGPRKGRVTKAEDERILAFAEDYVNSSPAGDKDSAKARLRKAMRDRARAQMIYGEDPQNPSKRAALERASQADLAFSDPSLSEAEMKQVRAETSAVLAREKLARLVEAAMETRSSGAWAQANGQVDDFIADHHLSAREVGEVRHSVEVARAERGYGVLLDKRQIAAEALAADPDNPARRDAYDAANRKLVDYEHSADKLMPPGTAERLQRDHAAQVVKSAAREATDPIVPAKRAEALEDFDGLGATVKRTVRGAVGTDASSPTLREYQASESSSASSDRMQSVDVQANRDRMTPRAGNREVPQAYVPPEPSSGSAPMRAMETAPDAEANRRRMLEFPDPPPDGV